MAEKTSGKVRKSTAGKRAPSQKPASVTPIGRATEGNHTGNNDAKSQIADPAVMEQIRFRAYELFEQRGRSDGFDQEDWARAEAEILARFQRFKSA